MNYNLIKHNIQLHGFRASLFPFGLNAIRMVEYQTVLNYLENEPRDWVLDIGCGYSLLPTLLATQGFNVVSLDMNSSAVTAGSPWA